MCTPSVTLRSLKNEDTGIDISVPRFKEEEAPLGGISILYEITVLTRLDLFKTRLHKSGDVVHFTIFKAYREIEELYNKLNKKYPKAGLPPVPKASSAGKYTSEERVEALDTFMSAIARNIQICYSSIFTQFIGINSQRLPSFSLPKSESSDSTDVNIDTSTQEIKLPEIETKTSDDSEIFTKMKNVSTIKEQPEPAVMKKVDLFEEEKLTKENKCITSTGTKGGLFDDFEDDNLFSSKPVEKMTKKEVAKKPKEAVTPTKKPEVPKKKAAFTEDIDDSQIIIQDRKMGDVSLFKEQDFGGFITKDEESLFLVTSPNTRNKKNVLLFSEDDILSPESDKSLNENLDDLLNLEPLPNTSFLTKKSENESIAEVSSKEQDPPKPQPRLRNKSIDLSDSSSQPKPEVMPRKIFLEKPSVPSKPKPSVPPPIAVKPQSSTFQSKPAPPPKPKVPLKKPKPTAQNENPTKDLDAINANESEKTDNLNTVSNLANDLKELDILKYIEQEEKSLDSELNLFD